MTQIQTSDRMTVRYLRQCSGTAVALTVFIAGIVAIYRADTAALNQHGWLYDAIDWLTLTVFGRHLFSLLNWDLMSVVVLFCSLLFFSFICVITLATLAVLVAAQISGSITWEEAKTRFPDTPTCPTTSCQTRAPVDARKRVGRVTSYSCCTSLIRAGNCCGRRFTRPRTRARSARPDFS